MKKKMKEIKEMKERKEKKEMKEMKEMKEIKEIKEKKEMKEIKDNETSPIPFHSNFFSSNSKYTRIFNPISRNVTPTRFWSCYYEEDFENDALIICNSSFSVIYQRTLKDLNYFEGKKKQCPYSNQRVAVKDPKEKSEDFLQEQYSLSREINCVLFLHPHLINYIGGTYLGDGSTTNPWRIGIVLELLSCDLRNAINNNSQLKNMEIQLQIARQIASGMNFLHSLNPYVLHRDLRTPNILLDAETLNCKIADFGLSYYSGFNLKNQFSMYTSLIPPECTSNLSLFSPKGDVYFYGWILIEMLLEGTSECMLEKFTNLCKNSHQYSNYCSLILSCINHDPKGRPDFSQILSQLNILKNIEFDLELIAQNNLMEQLKIGIATNQIHMNVCDSLERNLIHQCCIFGNLEMLKYLTEIWGIQSLQTTDRYQTTLTHLAARNGYLHILQFLHSQNCLSNRRDIRFQTSALDLSITMKHHSCVEFLILHSNQSNLNHALLNVCNEGNLDLVIKLVDQGANIESITLDTGATSLDRASHNGHLEIVKFLLQRGALVNQVRPQDGCSSLYIACENGHKEIVELLLQNGADVNKGLTTNQSTALFIACQFGYTEIVQILLNYGADPNKVRAEDGTAPIFMASQKGFRDIVQILLENGASLEKSKTTDGITPLFIACQQGHQGVVSILLEHNSDPNEVVSTDGTNALFIASQKGHYEIVKLLIEAGANVNQTKLNTDSSPLLIASQYGRKEIASLLLQHNADVNKKNKDSCTPLIIACFYGHTELVAMLLANGADTTFKVNGFDALGWAWKQNHQDVVKLFIKS